MIEAHHGLKAMDSAKGTHDHSSLDLKVRGYSDHQNKKIIITIPLFIFIKFFLYGGNNCLKNIQNRNLTATTIENIDDIPEKDQQENSLEQKRKEKKLKEEMMIKHFKNRLNKNQNDIQMIRDHLQGIKYIPKQTKEEQLKNYRERYEAFYKNKIKLKNLIKEQQELDYILKKKSSHKNLMKNKILIFFKSLCLSYA